MKGVELYGQVRRAVYVEGMSRREAARRFGIYPRTVESKPHCTFINDCADNSFVVRWT
jgi:hypothetical protein